MQIPKKTWDKYIKQLSSLNYAAGALIKDYVETNGIENKKALTDYAYYVVQKYGNGSAALSAAMYDTLAALEGANVAPAVMADLPDYEEVAKTVYGTLKSSQNPDELSSAASRLVKRAGADTTLKNAKRDGAQFAWVPAGDTCAFCLTLASNGWQYMSKEAMKGGHAEHIHANCDCTYAVRFDNETTVAGYDPQKYKDMYDDAEGKSSDDKINSLRRMQYQENKDKINAQKREAYAKRKEAELFRKTQNTGEFSQYKELMTKNHVTEVVSGMDLDPNDVKYAIDRNPEMINTGYMGHTSDDGKQITLYPDAFVDREQLVKTIGHENIHLNQLRRDGKVKSNEDLLMREKEAFASESEWWDKYVKSSGYRPEN